MPRFHETDPGIRLCIGLGRDPYDDVRTIAQECHTIQPGGCCLGLSDGTLIRDGGLVGLHANNRVWAIMPFPEGGYLDSFGRRFPDSAPGPVSPDGAIAIKVVYHSFGPWDVLEASGERWRLTDGDAHDIQLLGGRRAIWLERGTGYRLHARGVTVEQPAEAWGWPRLLDGDGRAVLLYQSYTGNALVLDGHIVADGINFFRPDAIVRAGIWYITWATQPQEYGVTPIPLAIPVAQLAGLPTIADRLRATPIDPPPPPPPPQPHPTPEPTMEPKRLPAAIHTIVVALYTRHRALAHGPDEQRRELQQMICETVRFQHPPAPTADPPIGTYGWKSNHGIDIANSTDALAELPPGVTVRLNERQEIHMWDLFDGTSRKPNPPSLSEVGRQFFVPVAAINHLADAPVEPPSPPRDLPTLHQWIKVEYPQLVAAYRSRHGGNAPDHEWAAFQTCRRGGVMLAPGEPAWSFEEMLAHEWSQNP